MKNLKYISNLLVGIAAGLCVALNLGQYLNSINFINRLNISDVVLNFIILIILASIAQFINNIYKKVQNKIN